jgi:hypothetical protein
MSNGEQQMGQTRQTAEQIIGRLRQAEVRSDERAGW